MENNEIKIIIEPYMVHELKLNGNELVVYAALASGINETDKSIKFNINFLAHCLGISRRTVLRMMEKLKTKKAIQFNKILDGDEFGIAILNNKYETIKSDQEFMDVIEYWNQQFHNANISYNNYILYKEACQRFSNAQLIIAIERYAEMIFNKNYFKTYIYSFDKFVRTEFPKYLNCGSEWESYQQFKEFRKNKNPWTASDREFKEEDINSIPDDEIGSVEM